MIAGFVSNHVQAIVAMLGAAAVGAVWTGISPDNGVSAVLDRLAQIEPKILFADNGMTYNGKPWSSADKILQIVEELKTKGLTNVIVINNIKADLGLDDLKAQGVGAEEYESFLKRYCCGYVVVYTWVLTSLIALLMPPSSSCNCLHLTPFMSFTRAARRVCQKRSSTLHWAL